MTMYVPHPEKPILIPQRGSDEPISLTENFFLSFTHTRSSMLSLANPAAFTPSYIPYRGVRVREPLMVSGISVLQQDAVEHVSGPLGLVNHQEYIHEGFTVLPVGSLLVTEAFNGAAKPHKWYGFRPQEEALQNPLRILFQGFSPSGADKIENSGTALWDRSVAARIALRYQAQVIRSWDIPGQWVKEVGEFQQIEQQVAHKDDVMFLAKLGLLPDHPQNRDEDFEFFGLPVPAIA